MSDSVLGAGVNAVKKTNHIPSLMEPSGDRQHINDAATTEHIRQKLHGEKQSRARGKKGDCGNNIASRKDLCNN